MIKDMKNKTPVLFGIMCVIAVCIFTFNMGAFVLASYMFSESIAVFWKLGIKSFALESLVMIISFGVSATLWLLGSVLLVLKKTLAFKVLFCAMIAFLIFIGCMMLPLGGEGIRMVLCAPLFYLPVFLVWLSHYAGKREWLA